MKKKNGHEKNWSDISKIENKKRSKNRDNESVL